MRSASPEHHQREWRFTALLLLPLLAAQALITANSSDIGVDGGYYTDVALHVRDGDGLVSDVSLYHAGFQSFPHASPIYPLWPLLFGLLLRLGAVEDLAHWVPFGFYVLALAAAFLFGRSLAPRAIMSIPGLHAGHLMALMLGAQQEFSFYSARPYTEALGFFLLMATLARAVILFRTPPTLAAGVELGLWMALCCLCRSQFFVVPIAALLSFGLLVVGGEHPRRWALAGAAALGLVTLGLATWWWSVADTVVDAGPLTLLRFDQAQANRILDPIDVLKNDQGPWDLLLDRLGGLAVAFDPIHWKFSYARGFYTMHWALPVAALLALPRLSRLRLASVREGLRHPDAFSWIFVVLVALGALATVHLPHKEGFGDWYFHRRHAIICVIAFFLCTLWLLRRPQAWQRLLGRIAVCALLGCAIHSFYWRVERLGRPPPPDDNVKLIAYLQQEVAVRGPVVVALQAFRPPELAWRTDGVGYHWFYERTTLRQLVLMFDRLGATLLIFLDKPTVDWAFRKDLRAFNKTFRLSDEGPEAFLIYSRAPG